MIVKSIFLLSCFFFSLSSIGQKDTLRIIDAETKRPIPFVQIHITGQTKGFITNYEGELPLDSSFETSDTCRVYCIGYQEKRLLGQTLIETGIIELTQRVQELTEVLVSAKKTNYKTTKLGVRSKPKTMFTDHYMTGESGEIKAVWIPNEKSISGFINSVNVYVTDYGFPQAYFRLHIYRCNPIDIKPGKELTEQNIVVNGTTGNEWIHIDLDHLDLSIPENGFFVGVEWFSVSTETEFLDTIVYDGSRRGEITYSKVYKGNGCVLGTIHEPYKQSKNKVWRKGKDGAWQLAFVQDESRFYVTDTLQNGLIYEMTEHNLYFPVPCIYAEVKYIKEKNDADFTDPKRRKLNKIEKTKENLFLYPQSSVDDLFSSIIKAIENDNLVYILKYLCVFKEDQLASVLEDLESRDKNELIDSKEKAEILSELKSMRESIDENNLEELEDSTYKLSIKEYTYYLTLNKGKWKINPYTYQIVKRSVE